MRSVNISGSGWTFSLFNLVASVNEKQDFLKAIGVQPAFHHGQRDYNVVSRSQAGLGKLDFEAAIFDMDGVLTKTATVHSIAWKRMFDEYLRTRETGYGEPFREFTHAGDYLVYVDGRPRHQGIETFLKSRGIVLPFESSETGEEGESIRGLGDRKNTLFNQIIESEGAGLYDSTVALIQDLLRRGIKVGLATSSKNSAVILQKTGTAWLFATVVDGLVSEKLGLKGKPEPDIFTTASANLGVSPARAIVIEDAVSGVAAGAKGGFGLVIGVAREDNADELRKHGADVVVHDLAETTLEKINLLVRAKRARA
ncbi:MAG TPA: HAD-IA family hydrolase [Lacunisphaera sp.]|jgi:beta-phosphoglucomutase family hydrolase